MLPPIILAALTALALLVALSIRRVPEGHVYTFRRLGGHVRAIGAGMHFVLPLVERVAHKISLSGDAVDIDGLEAANGERCRGTVYFQVIDPRRAETVFGDIGALLRETMRNLFADPAMPEAADARRAWLKQSLNTQHRERGLLIARVDLKPLG